MLVEINRKT